MSPDTATQRAFSAHALLHVYFNPPQSMGGGSKSGSVLSSVAHFAVRPCQRCKKRDRELDDWIFKSKAWATAHPDRIPYEEFCPRPTQADCKKCEGTGFVNGVQRPNSKCNRKPTGSSKRGSVPRLPASMADTAQASIVMRRVARENPFHRDVLLAHFGSAGDYAEKNGGARLHAVITLTKMYPRVAPDMRGVPPPPKPPNKRKLKKQAKAKAAEEGVSPLASPFVWRLVVTSKGELSAQQQRLVTTRAAQLESWRKKQPKKTPEEEQKQKLSAGEAMLIELVGWSSDPKPERQEIWEGLEEQGHQLLDAALQTWENCVDV